MHYPWWYVPLATSPMLIAVVSVVHVLVSHYAVGGGLFLAVETRHAYRTGDRDYLAYLKKHVQFFVLLTVVFGAITGVGIWWTIGLASPLATETLIQTFVFGWAIEYVFFVLEVASAFIFYYYWGRLDPKTHVVIGWIYGLSAWISLVLITGITAFMLNPGTWTESHDFWAGLLNPQFLPQTLARTGGALLLTTLYVYLHASLTVKDARIHNLIESRSARPALVGAVLIVIGGIGWIAFLPESARAALAKAAALNILTVLLFAITVVVFVILYLGPYRNPGWFSPSFAILAFLFGVAAVSTGEFIREAVRKPFVVYNVVLSNQILPAEIPHLRREGYLEGGRWTKAYVVTHYPRTIREGKIDEAALLKLPQEDRVALGRVLFQYHCNDCHADTQGYSAVAELLRGWTPEMIRPLVRQPEQFQFFMPPWCGTDEEAELLTEYLASIAPPSPAGMAHSKDQ